MNQSKWERKLIGSELAPPAKAYRSLKKYVPVVHSQLRGRAIVVPEVIYNASGIKILNRRIKSLMFTTDVALISNCNAQAIMAVYPFTPQLTVTQAILSVASVPAFVGVGGGQTGGQRAVHLALQSELLGAYGVVVNAPIKNEDLKAIADVIDIPILATVSSEHDDIEGKVKAGAQILNISGGKDTPELVRLARKILGNEFPIIATGGKTDEMIEETIDAGANAITFTPPTSAEIFRTVMEEYRKHE